MTNPHQDELPLSSARAHAVFPGRTFLRVQEVAQALSVSTFHVINLIQEGQIKALDAGGGKRSHWRIPVAEYDAYIDRRNSEVRL